MSDAHDLARDLGRIEGKLDAILVASLDQEVRIRSLEKSRSWGSGAAAAVGAGIGIAWNLLFGTKGH